MREKLDMSRWQGIAGFVLGVALAAAGFASFARAGGSATSTTGIPIEALFAALGGMGLIVYADVKRELRRLSRESEHRTRMLDSMAAVFQIVCGKLDIPWSGRHDS